MKPLLRWLLIFWCACAGWPANANDETDNVPLRFARLELRDGRKLKNVRVTSYDPATTKLLVVADGKALSFPIALLPAPYDEQLKRAPASGTTTNVTGTPSTVNSESMPPAQKRSPARPRRAAPIPVSPSIGSTKSPEPSLDETLASHQTAAQSRAQKYFRYEFPIGSSSISVTALEFDLSVPEPVPGWLGRCRTEGKAYIEYFDSKGRSYQRATSTFEVLTEQKPGEGVKVVDFTRKS